MLIRGQHGLKKAIRAAARREGILTNVSHGQHRGTLVPFIVGLFVVLMLALAASTFVSGKAVAAGNRVAAGTDGVRAQEWWLGALGAPKAWQATRGAGVTVAVLSTGVAANSRDLAGDVITGPDYSASGRTPGGPYWGTVGTAVASIIAGHGHGAGDNSGIIGIAPAAKILSVRVTLEYNDPLNTAASITQRLPSAIANGIMYAVSHGAKVIDLPLDPGTFGMAADGAASGGSAAEQTAVRYALANGVVLVGPGGDDGANAGQVNYPAAYPGVLAVGALSRGGQVASFSSHRSYVAVSAPGVRLVAASMGSSGTSGYAPGYSHISTTSVASGMVAGIAALIESRYPSLTSAQVTHALRQSATGKAGQVSALAALRAAGLLAPPARQAPSPAPPSQPAAKPAGASHAAVPSQATATPQAASAVASTVLRYVVYGTGVLIALLLGVLIVTQLRRRRGTPAVAELVVVPEQVAPGTALVPVTAAARPALTNARARVHGQHELRRPGRHGEAAHDEVLAGLRQLARPGSPVAAGRPAIGRLPVAAATSSRPDGDWQFASDWTGSQGGSVVRIEEDTPQGDAQGEARWQAGWEWRGADWHAGSDWQGSSLGEIAHSSRPDRSAALSLGEIPLGERPAVEPLPKQANRDEPGSAAPPWEPAPRPHGSDLPTPLRPQDLSGPFTDRDVLTQSQFGFAAAPVPADFDTDQFPAVAEPDTDQPDDEPA